MDGVYFPITIHEFASHVEFNDIKEETFKVDGITIDTMLLSHPGYCLGFRIHYKRRRICYITDNELFPKDNENFEPGYVKKLLKFIHGADMLIMDCTYTDDEYKARIGWGHSPVSAVVELAIGPRPRTSICFITTRTRPTRISTPSSGPPRTC